MSRIQLTCAFIFAFLPAIALGAECPCAPSKFVSEFRTQDELGVAAARAMPRLIQNAQQLAAKQSRLDEFQYRVVDAGLLLKDVAVGEVPFAGTLWQKGSQELRDVVKEELRKKTVQLVANQLQVTPEVAALDYPIKRKLVTQALAAAQNDPSFTIADEFQNTAIELMLASIDELETRQDFVSAQTANGAPMAKLGDLFQANQRIDGLAQKLKESVAKLEASRPRDPEPVSELRRQLDQVSAFSAEATNQLSAAAGIADKLGSKELARTLSRGSQLASVATLAVRAYAGDPTAYLPAINAVMGLGGGGGDSATAAALARISEQIAKLSEQVKKNHAETMERLNYVAFLGEATLEGVSQVVQGGLQVCKQLVPNEWWDASLASIERLDYGHPLVFGSYESLSSSFTSNYWTHCGPGLVKNLVQGEISAPMTLNLSTKAPSPADVQRIQSAYAAARALYPTDKEIGYLYGVPRWSEDLREPSYSVYVKRAIELAGKNHWDPRNPDVKLLDPSATEVIGGYALALHPLYDVTEDGRLLPFGRLSRDALASREVGLNLLRSALGHVNLALAQQQMLYGVAQEAKADVTKQQVATYTSSIAFAPYQIGLMSVGEVASGRIDREIYNSAIARSDVVHVAQVVSGKPSGLGQLTNIRMGQHADKPAMLGDMILGPEKAVLTVVLPQKDALGTVAPLPHSDVVLRLSKLQNRLIEAISASSGLASSEAKQFSDASLVGVACGSAKEVCSSGGAK